MKTILTEDKANVPYGYARIDGSGNVNLTGSLEGTASYAATASYATTASYLLNVQTIDTGSFAITGSNTFIGNQTVTGSVDISGSFTINGLTVDTRPYKVYTALLSQTDTGGSSTYISDGPLVIGATYLINNSLANSPGDFRNVGAPDNNNGTYFVATGTTPSSWGDSLLGYDPNAPTVIVLENTIGNIWYGVEDVNVYNVFSDNLFTDYKTYATIGTMAGYNLAGAILSTPGSQNLLGISTPGTSALYYTPIEIRVYN